MSPPKRQPDEDEESQHEMNLNLSKLALILAVLAGLAGLAGAWFILPYRMDAAEKTLTEHGTQLSAQREILIRIDENVKQIRREERDRERTRMNATSAP